MNLEERSVRVYAAFALVVLCAIGLVLGTAVAGRTASASATASMYVSPATITGTAGATVTVDVHMTVSGDTVNAVAANLTYSTDDLTYVGATVSPVWGTTAANTGGAGSVDVEAGTTAAVSGDQLVATVTFTKVTSGSASVTVASSSEVVSATTHNDLLHPSSGGGGGGGGGGTTTTSTSGATSTTSSTTTGSTTTTTPAVRLILPKKSLTPGVTNPAVTQTTIKKTICVSSWAATVRPSVSYTNTLKLKQMKQYGEKGKPSLYEEDHFIPLELGGAPKNAKNLWPEPHSQSKHSDPLETSLKRMVCAGTLTLAAARKQIVMYKRTHG